MISGAEILGAADRLLCEDGSSLRLLSAREALWAQQAGRMLARETGGAAALCSNACLLALAWEGESGPLYADGAAVLAACSISQIQALARRWAQFDRENNPGLGESEEAIDALKKAWSTRRNNACNGACSRPSGHCPRRSACGT